ncbi:MAG: hypothetical protein EA415_10695 [Sphaerobacteraceae bacterium]|nr:MAG: hypothetical protein EA415_10695 [Sphaerobacteraceae bacterium]
MQCQAQSRILDDLTGYTLEGMGPMGASRRTLISIFALLALMIPVFAVQADTVDPANEHFERTWERTDRPVDTDQVDRTWMWGPGANTGPMWEQYLESPDGQREVQYYDKSRMEINLTGEPEDSVWYVTNGLLVVEMVTGRMQIGEDSWEPHEAETNNVAGDRDGETGPSYADLAGLLDPVDDRGQDAITQIVDQHGEISEDPGLADQGVYTAHFDDITGHNVAEPFWEFMTSSGLVYESGEYVQGAMFLNPVYATGRPITEPYWAHVPVGGDHQWVLLQAFERRVLTYTPGNDEGWKVEAGNVGRHYFEWRYGYPVDHDPPPSDDSADDGTGGPGNGGPGNGAPPPGTGDDSADDDNGNGVDDDNGNGIDDDNGNGIDDGDNGNGVSPPDNLGLGIHADVSLLGSPTLTATVNLNNPSAWAGDVQLVMTCDGAEVDDALVNIDASGNLEVELEHQTSGLLSIDVCTVTALIGDTVVDSGTIVVVDILPNLGDVLNVDLGLEGALEVNLIGSNLLTLNGTLTNESDVDLEVTLEATDHSDWSDETTVTLGPGQSTSYSFDRDVGGLISIDQYTVTASAHGVELDSKTITSVNVL